MFFNVQLSHVENLAFTNQCFYVIYVHVLNIWWQTLVDKHLSLGQVHWLGGLSSLGTLNTYTMTSPKTYVWSEWRESNQ